MNYDNWKSQTPDSYEREEENTCRYCGTPIDDSKTYCSTYCRKGDYAENG